MDKRSPGNAILDTGPGAGALADPNVAEAAILEWLRKVPDYLQRAAGV